MIIWVILLLCLFSCAFLFTLRDKFNDLVRISVSGRINVDKRFDELNKKFDVLLFVQKQEQQIQKDLKLDDPLNANRPAANKKEKDRRKSEDFKSEQSERMKKHWVKRRAKEARKQKKIENGYRTLEEAAENFARQRDNQAVALPLGEATNQ